MKSNKIYIIAAICLLVGVAIFFAGFYMLDFNEKELATENFFEEKSYTSSKTITTILVDDANFDIKVKNSADDKIHISYFENDKKKYEISESDSGVLNVSKKDSRDWYNYFLNIQFESPTLTLEIPINFSGDITIDTSNSDITLENINAANINLTTSNDQIIVKNTIASGSLNLKSSNGDVFVSDTKVSKNIICNTSNDEINFSNVECESLNAQSNNGDISLKSVSSDKDIYLKTSNDDITLDTVKLGTELKCINSNGEVKGSVTGSIADYSFNCRTSNGDCNIPKDLKSGSKIIDIRTSNDDINIQFVN